MISLLVVSASSQILLECLFMISTMRFSLLAAFGSVAVGAAPSIAQSVVQPPMQIVPANPLQNTLPDPALTDPAVTDPAVSDPAVSDPSMPAPSMPAPDSEAATLEPLVQPAAAGETANYADAVMSVEYPVAWTVEVVDDTTVMIANVTTEETGLVATQVVQMAAPPGAVVNANIDSFIEEGSAVGRYRTVTIDGREALVMWLSERPDTLTQAIATFVDYGDRTVLMFSRYAPDNATAEEDILRLHTSYRSLVADVVDTAPEEVPAPPEDVSPPQ
jgi:hypothetical protein